LTPSSRKRRSVRGLSPRGRMFKIIIHDSAGQQQVPVEVDPRPGRRLFTITAPDRGRAADTWADLLGSFPLRDHDALLSRGEPEGFICCAGDPAQSGLLNIAHSSRFSVLEIGCLPVCPDCQISRLGFQVTEYDMTTCIRDLSLNRTICPLVEASYENTARRLPYRPQIVGV
jgi:hypothetical protein